MSRIFIMIKCKLCDFQCETNSGGDLTKHIKNVHDKSLVEYVIVTEYNNTPPKCQCGYCDDIPEFYRGYFKKYTYGHNSVEWLNKKRIELNLISKCLNCGKELELNKSRKKQKTFCSFTCSGTFNKDIIIEKMTPKIIHNYKTDESYGRKIGSSIKKLYEDPVYRKSQRDKRIICANKPDVKLKHSINAKVRWKDPDYRKRVIEGIRCALYRDKDRYDRFVGKSNVTRFTKLHAKWNGLLNLHVLGFVSEQQIYTYRVDELNENLKIIIEINGDYIHANPLKYKSDQIIRIGSRSYTADNKWAKDADRKSYLESVGYVVFTVWESDNVELIRNKLMTLIETRRNMLYSSFDYII